MESISQRIDAIDDPMSNRALYALLMSVLTDLTTLKTAHNTHVHTGAAGFSAATTVPTAPGLVGNFNTTV